MSYRSQWMSHRNQSPVHIVLGCPTTAQVLFRWVGWGFFFLFFFCFVLFLFFLSLSSFLSFLFFLFFPLFFLFPSFFFFLFSCKLYTQHPWCQPPAEKAVNISRSVLTGNRRLGECGPGARAGQSSESENEFRLICTLYCAREDGTLTSWCEAC